MKVLHPASGKREGTDCAYFPGNYFQWNRARKVAHASCELIGAWRHNYWRATHNVGRGLSIFDQSDNRIGGRECDL